jgi:hypothetical protein
MKKEQPPIEIVIPEHELNPNVVNADGRLVITTLEQAEAIEQRIRKGIRKAKRKSILKKIIQILLHRRQ